MWQKERGARSCPSLGAPAEFCWQQPFASFHSQHNFSSLTPYTRIYCTVSLTRNLSKRLPTLSLPNAIAMSALSPIHSDANYTSAEAHATDGPPREATITNSDGGTTGRSINYMLESIPIGMFHYRLLSICGLSFMADAMVRSSQFIPCHTHNRIYLI